MVNTMDLHNILLTADCPYGWSQELDVNKLIPGTFIDALNFMQLNEQPECLLAANNVDESQYHMKTETITQLNSPRVVTFNLNWDWLI